MSYLTIVLIVLAGIVVWLVLAYNSLVRRRTRVDEGWADIDVQLKRRYDLIPNLVATVKGYATHESAVFENVTKARAAAMGAASPHDKAAAENMLAGALKSLFAVAEAYPQLRAAENFTRLQQDLADTEDKIQASRRFYNGVVRDYNIATEIFPTSIVATLFGFVKREFFEIEEGKAEEREPVSVSF